MTPTLTTRDCGEVEVFVVTSAGSTLPFAPIARSMVGLLMARLPLLPLLLPPGGAPRAAVRLLAAHAAKHGGGGSGRPKAKQSLGQNFLQDEAIARRIVGALGDESAGGQRVVELGPGQGALTSWLLAERKNVFGIMNRIERGQDTDGTSKVRKDKTRTKILVPVRKCPKVNPVGYYYCSDTPP